MMARGARRNLAAVLCVLSVLCVPHTQRPRVFAQTLDFSGTWKLNRSASQITGGAGINGLGAGGAPPTLYISQAANGTVVIGSDINESHARTFRLAKGAIAQETGGVKETISIGADGRTLTVTVTAAAPSSGNAATSTLIYTKVQSDDPCEKWPTPCRYR
jgi:hypothetical protein